MVDKATGLIICTAFANGKTHDFKLYKASSVRALRRIKLRLDTGYQGIKKIHANSEHPIKRRKKQKLTKEQKRYNREISRERVTNERAIGFLKRFKILSLPYRNRRKRFGLRVNLLAGICNFDSLV